MTNSAQVNFRVEGNWTGWGHYTQVPIRSFDELKDVMSKINLEMVTKQEYPITMVSLVHLKSAMVQVNDTKVQYDLKRDTINNRIDILKNKQLYKSVNLDNANKVHGFFIIPAFKVFAISFYIDTKQIMHKFYLLDGTLIDTIISEVYFYQLL